MLLRSRLAARSGSATAASSEDHSVGAMAIEPRSGRDPGMPRPRMVMRTCAPAGSAVRWSCPICSSVVMGSSERDVVVDGRAEVLRVLRVARSRLTPARHLDLPHVERVEVLQLAAVAAPLAAPQRELDLDL